MKTYFYLSLISQSNRWIFVAIAVFMCLVSGCASQMPVIEEEPAEPLFANTIEPDLTQVVRYGRYTLVEVDTSSQHDILEQIIDVTIPSPSQKQRTTVADALRYALLSSGYQLCDTPEISAFNDFTLPSAHQHLGPIALKNTLSILAGPGWNIQVDHFNRKVCFTPEAVSAEVKESPVIKESEK